MGAPDREQKPPLDLEAALADPAVRLRVSDAIAGALAHPAREPWWQRYQQFLAGLASGLVVVLAFLLPSLQEQWDRHQSQQAIDRYAAIGRSLLNEGLYESAEKAFAKGLELSEGRRIDLLEEQLQAHVERVNEDSNWLGQVPEDLSESDFVYLLELEKAPEKAKQRAATLAAFGRFLAGENRSAEATQRLHEALELDPANVAARLNLGNLLSDGSKFDDAEKYYRAALALAPRDDEVLYDLALVLKDTSRCAEAEPYLRTLLEVAPDDPDSWSLQADCMAALGRPSEGEARARAAALIQRARARARIARKRPVESDADSPRGKASK